MTERLFPQRAILLRSQGPEAAHGVREVGGLLEERNGSEAGGPGCETRRGVFERNAAERQHWNLLGARGLGELLDAERRPVGFLRRRLKHGAKDDEVGAASFRSSQLVEVVAGSSDEQVRVGAADVGYLKAVRREMEPGAGRESNIKPVVDENARRGAAGARDRSLDQREERAGREVALADLNQVHSGGARALDKRQNLAAGRGFPVGAVAEQRVAIGPGSHGCA